MDMKRKRRPSAWGLAEVSPNCELRILAQLAAFA